ncbi:putative MO25-like protein At5g47540 [Rutidosis leptorrhynchoides]|uniref:putative MO25-like protein At5g47540 n=1 Tax=Rutidosis leptorrhynchoides TaxID=125765 RepID=UPI003A9941A5
MRGLFKQKPLTPIELVHQIRQLLTYTCPNPDIREAKRQDKIRELTRLIHEMKIVLYGDDMSEPHVDACAKLTQEFFKEDILRLLITYLPNLDPGNRQDITHVIANLQRQRVHGHYVAAEYLEQHTDILDMLIPGYDDPETAISYGAILRDCIRHQVAAKYILESDHMKTFFHYQHDPNFDISSDAAATFKELLTRHKSTVAEYLNNNYDWFFAEYNALLESSNYITRRNAILLLGAMLLDRSNTAVMVRYVSSLENMRILMNLLRDSNKTIQLQAFHVFKLFPANQNKPQDIVNVLVANKSKLLRFFADFTFEKADEQFEADKAQVMREIATLVPKCETCDSSKDCDGSNC